MLTIVKALPALPSSLDRRNASPPIEEALLLSFAASSRVSSGRARLARDTVRTFSPCGIGYSSGIIHGGVDERAEEHLVERNLGGLAVFATISGLGKLCRQGSHRGDVPLRLPPKPWGEHPRGLVHR